jgi:predicted AlkP superfamily phosphohydrolase/phosphomutase
VQGTELLLRQGEFSDWVPIKFELIPLFAGISGMVRFYAQQVHPHFKLYVSPINVDPMDPELPICHPSSYSHELSQAVGRFYTQGFPEDTKALSNEIFTDDEFLKQSRIVLDERLRMFDHEFSRFHEGLFFFYFSSVDQNTHMMWRCMDPTHPLYDPHATREAKQAVYYFYRKLDGVLRRVLDAMDDRSVLMMLSDHGFAPFRREFNLSTWLVENGYIVLSDPSRIGQGEFYRYVDWRRTKAYALGLNGLYINLEGRDFRGSVPPSEAEGIKQEIMAKLGTVRDPEGGQRIITEAYDSRRIYSGPYVALAPDIVVGYQSGYRISDEAVLGKFPESLVGTRTDKWAADHCMDPAVVPGTLLANREVRKPDPGLWDLAPSILQLFGLAVPSAMDGRPVFAG